MDSDKVTFRGATVQVLAAFLICFVECLTGMLFYWPFYNIPNFVSKETVLSKPMTSVDVSLLGGLTNIGALLLAPACGLAINKFGRKNTSMLIALPFIIAWTILSITNSVPWVIIAMAIAGCGTAGQAACRIYIAEFAQDSIRGAVISSAVSVYYLGVLISYTLEGFLSYSQMIHVELIITLLYAVAVCFLKESPVYLLQNGMVKEAAESIAFYKQTTPSSKQVEVEIAKIRLQLRHRPNILIEENEESTETLELLPTSDVNVFSEFKFLKKSQSTQRALITCLAALGTMTFMGNIQLQIYAETLFAVTVPSLDSSKCTVWLAVVFFVACLLSSFITEWLGRKLQMTLTCIGSSVCTLVLAIQTQYEWAPDWFTALMIYFYNFIFNLGVSVVPYILIGELFLPQVRGLCSSLILTAGWLMNFIALCIFIPFVEEYGFTPLFYGFTAVGLLGAIYSFFYQPETRGLSVAAIQNLFLKNTRQSVII
ncbi:unnamed protein product [Arctia plantaginis]|uniref:Major facilitator superfamily (MFS) profile domain-containing protein n=1 Tax=Arctia plantaginis TaxID=874455 RepID=A0A8S1APQ7_ARCPL|nr:unnamed protein product [Arctia plantaginis]